MTLRSRRQSIPYALGIGFFIEYPARLSVYDGKHVVQVIGDHRVGLFRLAVDIDGVVREGVIPNNFSERLRRFVYKE